MKHGEAQSKSFRKASPAPPLLPVANPAQSVIQSASRPLACVARLESATLKVFDERIWPDRADSREPAIFGRYGLFSVAIQ